MSKPETAAWGGGRRDVYLHERCVMTSAAHKPKHPARIESIEANTRANAAMARYARGDDDAFAELYEMLSPRLYRLCLHLCGEFDAEELLQVVFLKMHRARGNFVSSGGVTAWCFAIARTTHLDRVRYTRRRPETLMAHNVFELRAAIGFDPESSTMASALSEALDRQIEQLSDNLRVAFLTVKMRGMSYAEASAALEISVDAVKQRVSRACTKLKAELAERRLDAA